MLSRLDQFVGRIVEATKRAGIYDDAVIIVTSDHGGINKGHGGITLQEMETPFVVSGKGIKKGRKITDSMMQYDVASTVTDILGLQQPQDIQVIHIIPTKKSPLLQLSAAEVFFVSFLNQICP